MPSSISLALAAKLHRILSPDNNNGNKFVSFVPPLTRMQFKYSELDFFSGDGPGIDANTLELNRSNFATLVNQIPADHIIFNPIGKGLLWEVFENNVINNSVTARMNLSEDDKAKLAAAHKFCDENFAVYRSFKNAFDQYQLDYKEAKCSLELASGEEKIKLQKEWDEFREKMLMDRIKAAENDLLVSGKQSEVTAALTTISNLEAKKGISTLRDEIKLKIEDLFSKGVAERAGTEYLYTDFSPLGSFEQNSPAWSQVILYSSEINALCANAPEELKKLFADEAATEGVESISFEYAFVSVVREWFSETLLASSNWKFAVDGPLVSDGKIPASGLIPAYINKILCIRKLSYKQKKTATVQDKLKLAIISPLLIKEVSIKKTNPVIAQPFIVKRSVVVPTMRTHVTAMTSMPAMRAMTAKPVPGRVIVHDHRTGAAKLQAWRNIHLAKPVTKAPVKPAIKPTEPEVKEHSLEGIIFIAFECKRITASPNPDNSLVWD